MHLSGAIPVFLVSTISLRNETSCVPISEPSLETFIAITAGGANMIMNAIAIATADCSPTGTPINLPNVCIGPIEGLAKRNNMEPQPILQKLNQSGKILQVLCTVSSLRLDTLAHTYQARIRILR